MARASSTSICAALYSASREARTPASTTSVDAARPVNVLPFTRARSDTSPTASPPGVRAYLDALNKAAQMDVLEARAMEEQSYLWGV